MLPLLIRSLPIFSPSDLMVISRSLWATTFVSMRARTSCAMSRLQRAYDFSKESLGLAFERENIGTDLFERPKRLRLIEVAGEADLVASLDAGRVVPRVRRVRQHLAPQEGFDAALFE